MAYKFTQVTDDEEEQQATPGTSSISTASAPSMTGTAPATQAPEQPAAAKPPQQRGTGFVGMQSWLDAGAGRSKNIADASKSANDTEQNSLKAAAADTYGKINSQAPITAASSAKNVLNSQFGPGYVDDEKRIINPTQVLLDQEAQGNKTNLGEILNQKYAGPAGLTWQSGQGATDLGMLSGAGTAANVTARDAIKAGGYGRGMRALDAAIYGADADSVAAMGGAKNNLTKLRNDATDSGDALAGMAKTRADAIDAARNEARAGLEGNRADLLSAIDARVDARNKGLADAFNDTSVPAGMQAGQWVGATPGMANRSNIAGQTERKQFNALSRFLGTDDAPMDEYAPSQFVEGHRQMTPIPVPEPEPAMIPEKFTRRMVQANAGESAKNGLAQVLGGIFTGGILNPILAKMQADDVAKHHGVNPRENHVGWVNASGQEVDPYRVDETTGELIDRQTGEKIKQSDVENGTYVWNNETGKYERRQS